MTGPEHYAEAERLTAEGVTVVTAIRDAGDEVRRDALGKKAMGIWAQAQVHATLALAAGTLGELGYLTSGDFDERLVTP